MLTRLLLVLFSCLVFQQKCLADESYGYLRKYGFPKITCTTDPLPGECSFEYEVVSSRMTQSQAGASTEIALLKQTIGGDMGPTNSSNELCVKTVRDYMCKKSFQFTCTDEYILQDIHGVKTSCKEVEKYCVNATGILSNLLNRMVNCSMAIPPVERIKRHTLKCERFPDVKDDPLPCAKRNYKVLAINLTEQSRSQMTAHEQLASYASNISKECLNNVSDMICKGMAPACDRNETMVVELLSRQDCERIISCLNTTSKVKNLHEGMINWCRSLPDANTATKIPLSLVYTEFDDNITPKTHNDTKISTTPTTQSPILNKTDQTQSRNGTGESDGPNTTTRPFLNSTDQNRKPATMPKSSPTTQANITKPNAKSKPATKKPTVNATYQEKEKKEEKSVPNLTPTTELSKTPQLNSTSSPVVSRGNAAIGRYVYNATTTNDPKNHGNKAAQFNTRMNALAFLVISFLSICMWQ